MNKDAFNILIAGVGGQGAILSSRVLAAAARDCGYDVKISEIHGMSQRGGSVTTQIRCGREVAAPIISPGEADAVVAFEKLEALRALPWLKKDGAIIVNLQELMPMPVISGEIAYPEHIEKRIKEIFPGAVFIDALYLAEKAGNIKSVNMVLLGRLSLYLPIPEENWLGAIEAAGKAKFAAGNLKAFALGRSKAE
jgi:indolepyruvate ferredoxin oxidoreductase beta subunit